MDNKWIVVYDIVTKSNPASQTKIHWQMMPKPVAEPDDFGLISGNIADVMSQDFNFTVGSSTLYFTVLSPLDITLRQVGTTNPDRCFDNTYTNRGSTWDGWRVEVMPSTGSISDHVLTVLQPVSTGSKTITSNVANIDSNHVGAEVTDCVVVYSKDGTEQEGTSFTLNSRSGSLKAIVTDLPEGSYVVQQNGVHVSSVNTLNGVIYFTADLINGLDFTVSSGVGGGTFLSIPAGFDYTILP